MAELSGQQPIISCLRSTPKHRVGLFLCAGEATRATSTAPIGSSTHTTADPPFAAITEQTRSLATPSAYGLC
jgi:hypothetical protein